MDFKQYQKDFKRKAEDAGFDNSYVEVCLEYAEKLHQSNVPVIYSIDHLSLLVGYSKSYIIRATNSTRVTSKFPDVKKSFYRRFEIKKKNGSMRTIYEPLPSLKEIQVWILENILNNVEISPFAKAYRKGIKIIENLKYHKGQQKVYTLDVKNFFPSISLSAVEKLYLKLGYSPNVSKVLSRLCCQYDSLPQGAPTSPALSNIYLKDADDKISSYCKDRKIRYTRYADDLSFSGSEFNQNQLLEFVEQCLLEKKLSINKDKTKLMTPGMRQTVTGIVVNDRPQVVFYKRNKLRQEIFYIKTFGLESHIEHQRIKQKNYLQHILGRVNFVLQINPEDKEFQGYKLDLINLTKKQ